MTYPPAGFPPPSGPYSTPDPFQAGPPSAPSPFGTESWQPPVFQAGYGQAPPPPPPEPPRGNKRWLVITVVVAVVIAAAGTGTLLWWLNARGGESGGTRLSASPLPTSVPPLGAERPPRDQLVPSLENPPGAPRWNYRPNSDTSRTLSTNILGGDAYTLVVGYESYQEADGTGIIALDAGTGEPRWPKPTKPDIATNSFTSQTATKCVIDRAATTIGCFFGRGGNTDGDDPDVLVFLDTASGTELNNVKVPATRWGRVRAIYSAGDGFVVALNDELVGYRANGSEAWRTPYVPEDTIAASVGVGHAGVSVFGDQGIVVHPDGRVLDANTGATIVHDSPGLDSAAFTSGFALAHGDTLDFYNFAGAKTASVPSDGFAFIDGYGIDGEGAVGLDSRQSGSSGLYYPLVFKKDTGDLRALDPTSGRVLWTQRIGVADTRSVVAYGDGTTCFIIARDDKTVHVKAQTCQTGSDDPFVEAPTEVSLGTYFSWAGYDGQRLAFETRKENRDEVVSVDGATGDEVWRKSDPNLWLAQWIGSGMYSSRTHSVFRWF
ncbi:hypothetical protein XA26_00990 [Mycolicibacterium fortuitum]|uniref:Pyrrolo-quinoline quinone repeat domain-containing protein n=1 Tax=Mycolicibacterium fortuitum TaxID=1766 RepID=A0A0N9Y394_MYCFO|nr:PQQ-binding-like beta-propeller repeat protein [Mycolicibacterium fortuitum]ALI23965.1 hypothetical protein XA26_00990 [Mycolicibacterium fortuitum]UHJ58117.1 PQQ-binding-like beta-propeller repeat protein [Mycolicibacterium fortuitum]